MARLLPRGALFFSCSLAASGSGHEKNGGRSAERIELIRSWLRSAEPRLGESWPPFDRAVGDHQRRRLLTGSGVHGRVHIQERGGDAVTTPDAGLDQLRQ